MIILCAGCSHTTGRNIPGTAAAVEGLDIPYLSMDRHLKMGLIEAA